MKTCSRGPTRAPAVGSVNRPFAGANGNDGDSPILFSNGSRDGGSIVSDIGAVGCLRSLRARLALDGVSWVRSGLVEIAVGQTTAATESAPLSAPSLGRRSARELGSTSCSVDAAGYAGLNSAPWRNMACMMMARRRASATRALRIVDRLAIANAQSLSFSGPLYRVSMTFAASYKRVRSRRSPHFEMLPV
jgi:hypothetical protein